MPHLLLEKAEALFSGNIQETEKQTEAAKDFIAQFDKQPLWIPVEKDEAGNLGIATIEIEELDRPVLLAFLSNDADRTTAYGELELHEFPSIFVFALLMKDMEFDLCLLDGDDSFTIAFERLKPLWQLMKILDDKTGAVMTQSRMLAAYPEKFAKMAYRYCAQHRDIEKTWLGLVAVNADTAYVAVIIEGRNLSVHRRHIEELSEKNLSMDVSLMFPDSSNTDIKEALSVQAPFYTKNDRQDWIGAIQRRLFRPKVLIQMNLT